MTNYKWNDSISLIGNNITAKLISENKSKSVQNLTVNFLLLATPKGDTVSVTWNYEN